MPGPSLAGLRVFVGREEPGGLEPLLARHGARMVHVPLIGVRDAPGSQLADELARLDTFDWLAVTSVPGAARVGASARRSPAVRLGAVGSSTADTLARLAERPVDVVPDVQRAHALGVALNRAAPTSARFLLALADRAGTDLADLLLAAGHHVTSVVAYETVPTPTSPDRVGDVDALLLTSGSVAAGWAASNVETPPIVVAIGPSTARAAAEVGLRVDTIASDHSLDGLVDALLTRVGHRP